MIQAILFDLDGTLIDNDMNTFLPPYFKALTKKVSGLIDSSKLILQLTASTQAMVMKTNPAWTMEQAFVADFFPKIGVSSEKLLPLFDDFYRNEYNELRAFVQPIDLSRRLVARAFEKNYRVVIATMPVFPGIAIRQRLSWGNLADFPYALVTDYETMHASKPHSAYYKEIAQVIQCEPQNCLMVGNEVKNDIMPARKAGMKTFWVTNAGGIPTDVLADWVGTLEDFGRLLESGVLSG